MSESGAGTGGAAGALSGKTALVTGASGGIGSATARALAAEGMRVGLVGRRREMLQSIAEELGGWSLPCNLTDAEATARLRDVFAELAGGPPDLIVASAGVFSIHTIEETSTEELDRNLEVNLRASFLTIRTFLAQLKERGSGTIVQVGSVAGRRAFAGNGAYSASKFGVRGLHEVLLQELRGTGVRATLLEPAATDTSLWDPIGLDRRPELPSRKEMLEPMSVAACVVFVAKQGPRVQIPYLAVEAI